MPSKEIYQILKLQLISHFTLVPPAFEKSPQMKLLFKRFNHSYSNYIFKIFLKLIFVMKFIKKITNKVIIMWLHKSLSPKLKKKKSIFIIRDQASRFCHSSYNNMQIIQILRVSNPHTLGKREQRGNCISMGIHQPCFDTANFLKHPPHPKAGARLGVCPQEQPLPMANKETGASMEVHPGPVPCWDILHTKGFSSETEGV